MTRKVYRYIDTKLTVNPLFPILGVSENVKYRKEFLRQIDEYEIVYKSLRWKQCE